MRFFVEFLTGFGTVLYLVYRAALKIVYRQSEYLLHIFPNLYICTFGHYRRIQSSHMPSVFWVRNQIVVNDFAPRVASLPLSFAFKNRNYCRSTPGFSFVYVGGILTMDVPFDWSPWIKVFLTWITILYLYTHIHKYILLLITVWKHCVFHYTHPIWVFIFTDSYYFLPI